MQSGGVVRAALGDIMVYTVFPGAFDSDFRVRNVVTGVEHRLQNAGQSSPMRQGITSKWIYGSPMNPPATGCTPGCVLRWPITGGAAVALEKDTAPPPSKIVADGDYAAWISDAGDTVLSLHNATANTTQDAVVIATVGVRILEWDMAVVGGSPVIYYWAGRSAAGLTVRDVTLYRWTEAGGSQQVESFANTNSPTGVEPKFFAQIAVDTTYVAYNVWTPAGAAPAAITTVIRPVAGGAKTTIGGVSRTLRLQHGIATWHENFPSIVDPALSPDIWAWSKELGSQLIAAASGSWMDAEPVPGYAVFGIRSDGLHSWNAMTGMNTVLNTGSPLNAYATDGWVYFYRDSTIFRVKLE
ncbi:MAG: hypothetical protein EON61_07080 [Alphaproteobacteria bacterium]|nr:MAG: hypothetical protein EON61_07080 [Alphaproteobacteria bacterium]